MSKKLTKAEKKKIIDNTPSRIMTQKEWAEAQGWTHSEASNHQNTNRKKLCH